jgi:hypothetical protein
MTYQQIINVLDILPYHPDITAYINSFNGREDFMYEKEVEPERIALQKKMSIVFNEKHHTGCSWGFMTRTVQAVLNGTQTYEKIVKAKNAEFEELEKLYAKWAAEDAALE